MGVSRALWAAGGAALVVACAAIPGDRPAEARVGDERTLAGPSPFERTSQGFVARQARAHAFVSARGELKVGRHDRGGAVGVETASVSRGAESLAPVRSATVADGEVHLDRGVVHEVVRPHERGAEQRWIFPEAPGGTGDLVVRVRPTERVTGAFHDARGLFLSTDAGPLAYGRATFVDARGARTLIEPMLEGGDIVLRVPALACAEAAYPAVLDPVVSAESEIDAPAPAGPAPDGQNAPSISSNADGHFVAWIDNRGARRAIYGAHVNNLGILQDPVGLILTTIPTTVYRVANGASSAGNLIVWNVRYTDGEVQPGIYALHLDRIGKVLDAAPIKISQKPADTDRLAVASDGTNYLVVWNAYGGTTSSDIYGVRVGANDVLDKTPITIAKNPEFEGDPAVAFAGARYNIAYRAQSTVRLTSVGTDGTVGTPTPLPATAGTATNITRATNGTRHVVAFQDFSGVYAMRYTGTGTLSDPAPISLLPEPGNKELPRAAWEQGAGEFMILFRVSSPTAFRVARLPPIGAPGVVTTFTQPYMGFDLDFAGGATGSGLVYTDTGPGAVNGDIHYVRTRSGAPDPFLILSQSSNSETAVDLATDGLDTLAVWLDNRAGALSVQARRIGPDGKPLGTGATRLSDPVTAPAGRPRVAFDGANYLVVWTPITGPSNLMGARVAKGGTLLEPAKILATPDAGVNYLGGDVAFDGTNYLVVFERRFGGTNGVLGARVSITGALLEPEFSISDAPSNDSFMIDPRVAFDGTNHLVVWTLQTPGSSVAVTHIFGTRVAPDHAVLDSDIPICTAFLSQRAADVATDKKTGWLVVWEDNRSALESAEIYGARVSAAGVNLDGTQGFKIAQGATDESRPSVGYVGDGSYLVTWRDLRKKTEYDLFGASVSSGGKVFDKDGFSISAEPGDEALAAFARTSDKVLLGYQRVDPTMGYGTWRARVRAVAPGALLGGVCKDDGDCMSRTCIDAVCCSGDCGGCGSCAKTPGTCTPLPAGPSPRCPLYKCTGTSVECPVKCATDADCADEATCDTTTSACTKRVICIDATHLKDLSGKITDCSPLVCQGASCRTSCASVDDCAKVGGVQFLCDTAGKCVPPPSPPSVAGCAAGGQGSGWPAGGAWGSMAAVAALALRRLRRRSRG